MTLRRRVFAYVAAAAVASCALTVAVAVILVRHQISARQMSTLERQADLASALGNLPGALAPGGHVYGLGSGRPRRFGPRRADLVLAVISPAATSQGTVAIAGRSLLYVSRPSAAGRIVLVRAASLSFAEWRPFLLSLLLAGLGGALLAGVFSYLLARRLTRPIGELAAATARLAAGDRQVEVAVSGRDELADLAHSFNEMAGALNGAREAQRHFLESVSHELKTPLTSIRGYAEAIAERALAPEQASAVIAEEAGRLERLVADLLDLARLERVEFAAAREPVDLEELAGRVLERHSPKAQELAIELSCTAEPPALALADEDRLVQALSNLVENALRVTPRGGRVAVHAAPGRLSVCDSGPGLAPEDLPRAFDRFYLHDRYRSERPVGSGLGLAIVRQLTLAMGGTVQAAAEPGGGARFTLLLEPVRVPAAPAPAGLTIRSGDPAS